MEKKTFNKLVRIAYYNSEYRDKLIPVLKKYADVPEWAKDKTFKNPETGNDVKFSSLPKEEQEKLRKKFKDSKKEDKSKEKYTFKNLVVDSAKLYAAKKAMQIASKPVRAVLRGAMMDIGETKAVGSTIKGLSKKIGGEAFKGLSKKEKAKVTGGAAKEIAKRTTKLAMKATNAVLEGGGLTATATSKAKEVVKNKIKKGFTGAGAKFFGSGIKGKVGKTGAKVAGVVVAAAVAFAVGRFVSKQMDKVTKAMDDKVREKLKIRKQEEGGPSGRLRLIKGEKKKKLDDMGSMVVDSVGDFVEDFDEEKFTFARFMVDEEGKLDQNNLQKYLKILILSD